MEDFLVPERMPRSAWRMRMNQVYRASDPEVPSDVDLVLYEPGLPCPQNAYTLDRDHPENTIAEILREKNDIALALARQFPAFRKAVMDGIIHEVAKENALFALATAVPNIVPNFVELPWIFGEFASDTVFLTANQVRMAFQIAAAAGHKVGFAKQKGELLTIMAGAFGWRALARELVSHIPLGGGLIPKGAIAYAGTFAVGKALEYYHYGSQQPTAAERRQLYQEGLERGKGFAQGLQTGESRA
jgi:uncharacterized protein (DUF697 family)